MRMRPLGQRVTLGAFAAEEPWPDLSAHYELERELGARLPIMSWFLSMDTDWPAEQAAAAAQSGHDLLLCLEPVAAGRAVPFGDILAGSWDQHLDSLFRHAAAFPGQVTIRFAHEPNLARLPQSIVHSAPCTTDLDVWRDTWRYVTNRQRSAGGTIAWMWCVDAYDTGGVPAESYWPGEYFVDVLGIDAYNGYGSWTSPRELIRPMYERVTGMHPEAQVWLAEVGCRPAAPDEAYDKASWFEELFATADFPRLTALAFFHSDKEWDWRITTPTIRDRMSRLVRGVTC